MSLQLYIKDFPDKAPNEQWVGVIVLINESAMTGEVMDATFAASPDDLIKWFEVNKYKYQASPCYSCSMIASLHAYTPEQAATFKFNCSPRKQKACRTLHCLRLQGPPGASGCDGGSTPPTEEQLGVMRRKDAILNAHYNHKVREAQRIFDEEE